MLGQLVSVSSTQKGRLSLTKLTGGGSKSALDVQKRTMGSVKLSDNVKALRAGEHQPLVEIELEDITRATVPAGQITYVHTDYAGNADIVVLNDATGDCYTYGMLKVERPPGSPSTAIWRIPTLSRAGAPPPMWGSKMRRTPSPAADLLTYTNYRDGKPYGVVEGPKRKDGTRTLGTAVELKSVDNVRSDAFDMDEMTLTLPSMVLPIADNVQCYNKATETWFAVGRRPRTRTIRMPSTWPGLFRYTDRLYDKSPTKAARSAWSWWADPESGKSAPEPTQAPGGGFPSGAGFSGLAPFPGSCGERPGPALRLGYSRPYSTPASDWRRPGQGLPGQETSETPPRPLEATIITVCPFIRSSSGTDSLT